MKKFLFFAISIIALSACGGESVDRADGFSETASSPEDSLFDVVMDEHNVAMAKMNQLKGYIKRADSAKNESLSSELKQAEDNMNKWMDEFSIDSAQDDSKTRMEYLTSEQTKVTRVKEQILGVLAKADSVLKK